MQGNLFNKSEFPILPNEDLEEFARVWANSNCKACQIGNEGRKSPVIYRGNIFAPIVIIAEAPGADEDREGVPMIGRAGRKLNYLLNEAGIKQDQIYITNAVKCRPLENRKPKIQEILTCQRGLFPELYLKDKAGPIKVIIATGSIGYQALFSCKKLPKVTEEAGKVKMFNKTGRETPVLLTYHPSFVLRIRYSNTPFGRIDREEEMIGHLRKAYRDFL